MVTKILQTDKYRPNVSPYFSKPLGNCDEAKNVVQSLLPTKSLTNLLIQDTLLRDVIRTSLNIIIIGYNPGYVSAKQGHHYAGPTNHMWPGLYYSGLIPNPLSAENEREALNYGIGFTNIVDRITRSSADISRAEMEEGAQVLMAKLIKYQPKLQFSMGKVVYVMPSSSARCSQLPRLEDKLPYFVGLRKLRDHLTGLCPVADESEFTFQNTHLQRTKRKL